MIAPIAAPVDMNGEIGTKMEALLYGQRRAAQGIGVLHEIATGGVAPQRAVLPALEKHALVLPLSLSTTRSGRSQPHLHSHTFCRVIMTKVIHLTNKHHLDYTNSRDA